MNFFNHLFLVIFLTSACARPVYPPSSKNLKSEQESNSNQKWTPQKKYNVDLIWQTLPNTTNSQKFVLIFKDKDGLLLTKQINPEIRLWMPSMGHGSAPVTITPIAYGIFVVTDIYFIMPGDWDIELTLPEYENEKTIWSYIL